MKLILSIAYGKLNSQYYTAYESFYKEVIRRKEE